MLCFGHYAGNREELMQDWVMSITEYKVEDQFVHLEELLQRTIELLPPSVRENILRNRSVSNQAQRSR
jgi:hypothetical protein